MNVVVSQNVVQGISAFVTYMRSISYNGQMLTRYKNNMLTYLPSLIQNTITKGLSANNRGYVYYRIPQNRNVWVFNFVFNPKNQVATIIGWGLRPLTQVNRTAIQEQEQKEKERNIVRITESKLKSIIDECVEKALNEKFKDIKRKGPFNKKEYPYLNDLEIERLNRDWPKIQNFTQEEWEKYFLRPS